jgi:hypothetical protein
VVELEVDEADEGFVKLEEAAGTSTPSSSKSNALAGFRSAS